MIDFNAFELAILAALAVIVFGPERLPETMRKAARILNHLRGVANGAQERLRAELGPEVADLQLTGLDPRALIQTHVLDQVEADLTPVGSQNEIPESALVDPVRSRP